jgi:oligopeptide/dipeptide ABC transporter ATP-binding protein
MSAIFELDDLTVEITTRKRLIIPVDGVSLSLDAGECLGLVGESGSGKSLTLKAAIGLLPPGACITGGELRMALDGDEPVPVRPELVRGHGIAMVFQEPMTSLDPTMRVGDLVAEGFRERTGARRAAARTRAVELMEEVGIPDAARRASAWPHELSGGLRQRVMIAMALSCEPRVLLCDEPTTALDVTVQDQILGLLDRLRKERGLGVLFVTHDLAVIGQIAHRVAVMYAGQIVEDGSVAEVFADPRHPYTKGLLRSVPRLEGRRELQSIGGSPPDPFELPAGCRFAPRCKDAREECAAVTGALLTLGGDRRTACVRAAAQSPVADTA